MPERLFRIRGHVQGVGYRWWATSIARRLDLTGTVGNQEDGSVELRARGSEEGLARLRAELRTGPPGARVASVDEEETTGVPADAFSIIR